MKKILFLFFILITSLLVFCGCDAFVHDQDDPDKITIVTTNFVGYDFARTIAGDHANITMLLAPGEETHSFDPTPADIIKIRECDIFLYVGGESDEWIRDILSSTENETMMAIAFMDCVSLHEEEHKEGMMESRGHDHAHDHEHDDSCEIDHEPIEDHEDDHETHDGDTQHNEYDEHVWTSVSNAVIIAEAIEDAIIAADPENEEIYHENAHAFIDDLAELDLAYRNVVAESDRNWILFGDRFPFLYMMKEYGLDYYAAFPGCSSETEPNASTIAFLIDKGRDDHVTVVLKESLSNGNIASAIAEEIDANVMTMYACDNISVDDFENGETYITLMEKNLIVLEEALNGWH